MDRVKVVSFPYNIQTPRRRNNTTLTSDINLDSSSDSRSNINNSDRIDSDRTQINNATNSNSQSISILQNFHLLLRKAFTFKSYKKDNNMRLYLFLKDGKEKEKGWLRDIIANQSIKKIVFENR